MPRVLFRPVMEIGTFEQYPWPRDKYRFGLDWKFDESSARMKPDATELQKFITDVLRSIEVLPGTR